MTSQAATRSQRSGADVLVRRALLLATAVVALTGVLAGLARIGVGVAWGPSYAFAHGPLMTVGVFGTVIALERAVALARPWALAAPLTGSIAAFASLCGFGWASWAATLSSALLLAVNAAIVGRQMAAFTWLMLAGSVVLLAGNLGWAAGRPLFEVVPAWMGFFVLTITAERLELSRLAPTSPWATRILVVLSAIFALLACASAAGIALPDSALGTAMAALALWQLRFDLARRTVRLEGLPRFAAVGVLLGASWLLATGVFLAATGVMVPAGPLYDAVLHGVFVGYVLSMVFAHAPIILPAVARVRVPFHAVLYVPLASLHASLLLRVAGDLLPSAPMREAGAVGNALSIAMFAIAVLYARRAAGADSA